MKTSIIIKGFNNAVGFLDENAKKIVQRSKITYRFFSGYNPLLFTCDLAYVSTLPFQFIRR